MIVLFYARNPCAHVFHDAHALMAQNAPGLTGRHITFKDVQIRTADRRFKYFDYGISRPDDFRHRPIFKAFFAGPLINEGFHYPSLFSLKYNIFRSKIAYGLKARQRL